MGAKKIGQITGYLFLLISIFLFPKLVGATYGDVSTYTGKIYDGDGGQAIDAYLDFPEDITVDSSGNFYIADTYNNVIRKINTSGVISTLAGSGSYGDDNGGARLAEFALPKGVAVDSSLNVYVADTVNHQIRKISTSGSVSTLVGSGLKSPEGVAVKGSTLYILDTGNNALKKIATGGGNVSTITSSLKSPKKLVIDSTGNYAYVADSGNYRVVKVRLSDGQITLIAGSGSSGYKEGTGSSAKFENIWGVTLKGNSLFVSDGDGFTDMVREIDLSTNTTSLFASDANMASINYPAGLVVYGNYVYVANSGIGTIEKFNNIADDPERGASETIAGAERFGNRNGSLSESLFGRPYDLVMSPGRKYLYVADNNKIRKINLESGTVSHLIGNSVDNYREGADPSARFSSISGMTINSSNTILYVADRWNNRIRKIDLTSTPAVSSLISGAGLINTSGEDDNGYQEGESCGEEFEQEVESCAYFKNPAGIVISPDNLYLYVTDTGNNRIRQVRISDGQTSLIAGSGVAGFADGSKTSAKFNRPFGITVDEEGGYLYVADSYNYRIRKIKISTGEVSTISGSGSPGYQEGVGLSAYFSIPEYIKMGADGFLYVSEVSDHVRQVNPDTGLTKLVAGSGVRGFKNGAKAAAKFNNPKGLAVDYIGNKIYLADSGNDLIRKIDITGEAPYADAAPQVSGVSPTFLEISSDPNATIMLQVTGANFRYGAVTKFGHIDAIKTYVASNSLAVNLPYGSMPAGIYDIQVENVDGQYDILERAFSLTNKGVTPDIHYEAPGATLPVASGTSFMAYGSNLRGGYFVAVGDVRGGSNSEIITGTGQGMGPQVRIFNNRGYVKGQFFAYPTSFRSGVRVSSCNLKGDSKEEIITIPGPGTRPEVRIFNALGQEVLSRFLALDGKFLGGAYVACGDVNGDGSNEIIVTAGKGGGAQVMVYNKNGRVLANFFAYDKNTFKGGIRVAVLDFDNDGRDEIVTSPEFGASHIQMFSVRRSGVRKLNPGFFAFPLYYKGGTSVSAVDLDGDQKDEIVVGGGQEAQPVVKVFNKSGTRVLEEFLGFEENFRGGINLASGDVDGDGKDELILIPRSSGVPQVKIIEVDKL